MNEVIKKNSSIIAFEKLPKKSKSPLVRALQYGDTQEAQKIIEQVYSRGEKFSVAEEWQVKVFKDLSFSDKEFLSLSPENKYLVYRTANALNKVPLVARLNFLGMYPPEWPIENFDIINQYMDCSLLEKKIFDFLIKLRKEGRLLTQEECNKQLDDQYIKKYNFTRILGYGRLQNLTKKLKLNYIKLPKKIAVVKSREKLSVKVEETTRKILIPNQEISIYAETVNRSKRFISRKEIKEIFDIIEESNFTDFSQENIFIAEDGIYFIDTEFKSFEGYINWDNMDFLKNYVKEKDKKTIDNFIKEKKKKNKSSLKLQNLGEIYQRYLTLKSAGINSKDINNFVTTYKEEIKIAKAVGVFNTHSFSFPLKDILEAV